MDVQQPFTWASGWKSPIYCDNRKTLSFPKIRKYIATSFTQIIKEKFKDVNVIAGVATGGIAHGVLVADMLDLPFIYVRSTSKGHGLGNQIEGKFSKEQKIVVVEDLVSTGKSSLSAVRALKESELHILGMVSIFDYGFDVAVENFKKENCDLYSLCTYPILIEEAFNQNYLSAHDDFRKNLSDWRANPSEWMK